MPSAIRRSRILWPKRVSAAIRRRLPSPPIEIPPPPIALREDSQMRCAKTLRYFAKPAASQVSGYRSARIPVLKCSGLSQVRYPTLSLGMDYCAIPPAFAAFMSTFSELFQFDLDNLDARGARIADAACCARLLPIEVTKPQPLCAVGFARDD